MPDPLTPEDKALYRQLKAEQDARSSRLSRGETANAPSRTAQLRQLVQAWAVEFGVASGQTLSITATQLYRHFQEWCVDSGRDFDLNGPAAFRTFADLLSGTLGLQRGRKYVEGRDTKPYLMVRPAALHFQAWEREHPLPPLGLTLPVPGEASPSTIRPTPNEEAPQDD